MTYYFDWYIVLNILRDANMLLAGLITGIILYKLFNEQKKKVIGHANT